MKQLIIFSTFLLTLLGSLKTEGQVAKTLDGIYKGKLFFKGDPLLEQETNERGGIYAIFYFSDNKKVEMSSLVGSIPSSVNIQTYKIIGNKIYISPNNKTVLTIRKDGKLQTEDEKIRIVLTKIND